MDWKTHLRETLGRAARQIDDEVIEEIAQHADSLYRQARAEGLESAAAVRRVHDQLEALAREADGMRRPARRAPALAPPSSPGRRVLGVAHDIAYALRGLRRQPGQAAIATLTIALGVAATTALFSVAYGVLLKPLPWPDADRLVRVYETREGSTRRLAPLMTNLSYREWREDPTTIEDLAGWSGRVQTLADPGAPERILLSAVTASVFPLLRAEPLLGRLFGPEDERGDADQVVLSHGLWQQRFGGDPSALGRVVQLDGRSYRVAAVMPPSFAFPDRETRAWIPLDVPPVRRPGEEGWTLRMFNAMARLKPGVTPEQAAAEGTARGRGGPGAGPVAMAVFGSTGPVEVTAVPARDAQTAEVRPALLILLAAAGLLLVTATANVAGVQLARGVARRREFAIRGALGASTPRVMRQLLVENLSLGVAGGLAGLLLAGWLHRALPILLPADFPRAADVAMDWRVAGFAILASLAAGLAFGLLPALQARRIDVSAALAEDGLAPAGGGLRSPVARARAFILAGQVAVACVLLLGATLLARSFLALVETDRGYDPQHVLTARLVMPDFAYTPHQRVAVVADLLDRLQAVPGVTHAGITTALPLTEGEMLSSFPLQSPRGEGTVTVQTGVRHVSPGYFAAMRMRLAAGRAFTDADTAESPGVAVVNQAFARAYLSADPLGDRLPARVGRGEDTEVVGILEDVRHHAVTATPQPEVYYSFRQLPAGLQFDDPLIAIRASGDPLRLAPLLRGLVREQDATIAVESIMPMENRLLASLARPRLYAWLLGGFALLALVIAGVGLFGVLAYGVAQRTREIGVRTALGARPSQVMRLVLRQALSVTVAGVVAGLLLSLALVGYLESALYGVAPWDPVSFMAVPVVLLLIAALACVVPARRAATLDPLRALRGNTACES
jgi:putative ABC transport system permease protein